MKPTMSNNRPECCKMIILMFDIITNKPGTTRTTMIIRALVVTLVWAKV